MAKRKCVLVWSFLACIFVIGWFLVDARELTMYGIGSAACIFVVTDTLVGLQKAPPKNRQKRYHAVVTCGMTSVVGVICIVMLLKTIVGD